MIPLFPFLGQGTAANTPIPTSNNKTTVLSCLNTGLGRKLRMQHRRSWILAFTCLAALCCLCGFAFAERPASNLAFEGKPLSQWLDNGFEDASRALYEIGPPAAPAVFAKLKCEHPQHGTRARYKAFYTRVPVRLRSLFADPKPAAFDELRAVQALLAIGPAVIPALRDALSDSSFLVRSVSAQTLASFRQRGRRIDAAIPALLRATCDHDPEVARNAKAAITGI